MNRTSWWLIILVALGAIAAGAYYWSQQREQVQPAPEPEPIAPRVEAPPAPPAAVEPEIRHPIEQAQPSSPELAAAEATPLPPVAQSDKLVHDALIELVGREPFMAFLNVSGYVNGFVATVDNLPSKKAAVQLWPVTPTAGRFVTEAKGGSAYFSAENDARYEPFIRFVESVDTGKAVALYVRLYPLFQRAYEELGYPNRYFNDRLIDVIDHLLATPDVPGPSKLTLPEVKGPIQPARPWVMYQFADPELEARSAGQKILIRMGSENAARLKTKLGEIRQQVAGGALKQ